MSGQDLPWRRWTDTISAFLTRPSKHRHPVYSAVFCTHDFHPAVFDRHLLPALSRRGRFCRTLVLADAKALARHVGKGLGSRRLGAYQLSPVRCGPGVFHPKCFLISDGLGHHLVGIGSGTLTDGGMGGNLELQVISDQRLLVGGVADFLSCLVTSSRVTMLGSARSFLREIVAAAGPQTTDQIIHSLAEPVLTQLRQAIPGRVHDLDILSPWHPDAKVGKTAGIMTQIRKAFGKKSRISVFTEQVGSVRSSKPRGPAPGAGAALKVLRQDDDGRSATKSANDADHDAPALPARLHAKAYRLVAERGTQVLFIGSANCTNRALGRSVAQGGNVELLVRCAQPQVAPWYRDLQEFFVPATPVDVRPPKEPPNQAPGIILAGSLRPDGSLLLESTRRTASAAIRSPQGSRRPLAVVFRAGRCVIAATTARTLIPEHDSGANDHAGCFLEEVQAGAIHPFPVTWAHRIEVDHQSDAPVDLADSLEDLLASLSGWSPCATGSRLSSTPDGDEGDAGEDADYRSWLTESDHVGSLDRVAVMFARILRALGKRPEAVQRIQTDYLESLLELPSGKSHDQVIRTALRSALRGRNR